MFLKSKSLTSQITNENNKIITKTFQIAEAFNTYFCNIGTKMLNIIKCHLDNIFNTHINQNRFIQFFLQAADEKELIK